jgi:hypothetical protein
MGSKQTSQAETKIVLMRVRRFARAADMAPSTVYALLKSGAIKGVRIGSALRIPSSELTRLERGEITAGTSEGGEFVPAGEVTSTGWAAAHR